MIRKGIELRHLRAFRAVMTVGSTRDAAGVLGLSQPSVSRLLAELETVRGEALFVRRGGRLFPTERARSLVPEVEGALQSCDALANREDAGPATLSIAAPNGLATTLLPPVVRTLRRRHLRLRVSVELMNYHQVVDAVAMGRADLGLAKEPVSHPALDKQPLITVPTVVLLPMGHPLTGRHVISVADLSGVPLVLLGRHRPFRVELDEAMERAGIVPNVVLETHAVNVARAFVEEGIGITLANGLIAMRQQRPSIEVRPFALDIPHSFVVVTSRNASIWPALDEARTLMRDVSAELCAPMPARDATRSPERP